MKRGSRENCLTQANAILGQGQLSLAKYLWIAAVEDAPTLDVYRVGEFLSHVLARVRLAAGPSFSNANHDRHARLLGRRLEPGVEGGHAAAGPAVRELPTTFDERLTLPESLGFAEPSGRWAGRSGRSRSRLCQPGPRPSSISPVRSAGRPRSTGSRWSSWSTTANSPPERRTTCSGRRSQRSNPASDIFGIDSFYGLKNTGAVTVR